MRSRPGGEHDRSDRAGPSRSGLGSRRVVWTAFGASVALHLLAIVLYPLFFDRLEPGASFFSPPITTRSVRGTEVIRIVEIEETPEPTTPEEPDEIEEEDEPVARVEVPQLEGVPDVELAPPGPTAAERLRPNLVDARLWRSPPPEFFELTLDQREELILADRITSWLDSVQAAQAAEERLTDWTFTDGRGGRWGVSPGKLHLGDITLPLPLAFGTPVGKRDETNQLLWQWEEIMRQAGRAEVELSWRERAEAIRKRRDAERAAARGDTIGR
jgi:hypothetical protein